MRIDGRPVHFRSARGRAGRRHRHGPPGAVDRAVADGGRERVPRPPADQRRRRGALARDGARGQGRICERLGHRHRSRGRDAAGCRSACSSWSSSAASCSAGADHHPGRADLGSVAAGDRSACSRCCAGSRREGTSFIFISHFLEDVLEVSDRVTVFRNSRRIATAKRGHGRQALADRADDRPWPRGARGGARGRGRPGQHRQRRRSCWRRTGLTPQGRLRRRLASTMRAGEVLGLLRLHGLGPARARPGADGQADAGAGRCDRRQAGPADAAPRGAKRAGIALVPESRRSMLFADEPVYKNISISILERIGRLLLRPARSGGSRKAMSTGCGSGPTRSSPSCASCRAATSRRWRWRAG